MRDEIGTLKKLWKIENTALDYGWKEAFELYWNEYKRSLGFRKWFMKADRGLAEAAFYAAWILQKKW